MKKQVIYSILSLAILTVLFSSCMQEPIFSAINAEIKLEESTVAGNVYSIVESENTLYVANGKIFKKNKSIIRGWEEASKPDGFIIGLAVGHSTAGDNYLYVLNSDKNLYGSIVGSNNWQLISSSVTNIVCNNAPTDADKKAYAVTSSGACLLDGTTVGTAVAGTSASTVKAAYLPSGTYFHTSKAFTSNQNDTLYKFDEENLITYSQDAGVTWLSVNINGISSTNDLAYDSKNNNLIIGFSSGFYVLPLENDGKPKGTKEFVGKNCSATIGTSNIITVYASNGYYYAASILKDNSKTNGLWGYYGADRNNEWNRE